MKPAKKRVLKKKELRNNKSVSKIENFFKSTPVPFAIEDECNKFGDSKTFYIEALKKKLQGFAVKGAPSAGEQGEADDPNAAIMDVDNDNIHNEGCVSIQAKECTECAQKDAQIKNLETKYTELKKVHYKHSAHFLELDIKYNDLLKTKTRTNQLDVDNTVASEGAINDNVFSKNEIKSLERISLERKNDSSFILKCLEYGYKSDLSILRTKSLKGKPEVMFISEEGEVEYFPAKDPLTPTKVERIKELFVERLSKCEINSVVFGERIKDSNINKLFAAGIKNIAKKKLK